MTGTILPYKNITPTIHETAFIAPGAVIIGDVHIGAGSNIWYNAVIRGDVQAIRIGANTNIQDGAVIHVSTGGQGTHIGDGVTVGHLALLHDCTIEDKAYIGMQSCVMDGATVESYGFLAAGGLMTPGKHLPSKQLWAGSPAKYMRDLDETDIKMIEWSWAHYRDLGAEHKNLSTG